MEPGYARWCNQTWLIGVDDAIARTRLLETRGMTEAEANQRLASMVPLEVRAPGADWVYKNNGSLDELRTAVHGELDRLLDARNKGEPLPTVFHAWWAVFLEKNKERLARAGTPVEGTKQN